LVAAPSTTAFFSQHGGTARLCFSTDERLSTIFARRSNAGAIIVAPGDPNPADLKTADRLSIGRDAGDDVSMPRLSGCLFVQGRRVRGARMRDFAEWRRAIVKGKKAIKPWVRNSS
jgi:hypothetical protein